MWIRTMLMATCLWVIPSWGSAQGIDPRPPEDRIAAALASAAAAGIPSSILELKVKEGEAKNVPMVRVAEAIEDRLQALVAADAFLRDLVPERVPPAPELTVAADAILAGIELETLEQLHRETPADQRIVAMSVLAEVVRMGVPVDAAAIEVRDAVRAGADRLLGLPGRVRVRTRGGGG
jgi:hypothetical protein